MQSSESFFHFPSFSFRDTRDTRKGRLAANIRRAQPVGWGSLYLSSVRQRKHSPARRCWLRGLIVRRFSSSPGSAGYIPPSTARNSACGYPGTHESWMRCLVLDKQKILSFSRNDSFLSKQTGERIYPTGHPGVGDPEHFGNCWGASST